MMLTDDELRDLADRWERWARYDDPSAFDADDAERLLMEVRELRVAHVRLVALVRQGRDRWAAANAQLRELLLLPAVQAAAAAHAVRADSARQDVDDDTWTALEAAAAHDTAEIEAP